jgi:hypothetical protein
MPDFLHPLFLPGNVSQLSSDPAGKYEGNILKYIIISLLLKA